MQVNTKVVAIVSIALLFSTALGEAIYIYLQYRQINNLNISIESLNQTIESQRQSEETETTTTTTYKYSKCGASSLGSLLKPDEDIVPSDIKNLHSVSFTYPKSLTFVTTGFSEYNKYYCSFSLIDPITNSILFINASEFSEFGGIEITKDSYTVINNSTKLARGTRSGEKKIAYGTFESTKLSECRVETEMCQTLKELGGDYPLFVYTSDNKSLDTFDDIVESIITGK